MILQKNEDRLFFGENILFLRKFQSLTAFVSS